MPGNFKKFSLVLFLSILFFILPPKIFADNGNPIGSLDAADCNSIVGWAGDPDRPNDPIEVHIYKDGPAGSGSFSGSVMATLPREYGVCQALGGTNCNHGYTFTTPQSFKDGQLHTIYAYGLNYPGTPATENPLQWGAPRTIQCRIGDQTISAIVKGYPLTIKTTQYNGGAIDSLKWNGKEFVDNADHGRLIQTAWTVNQYGQCYNPTEGGGASNSNLIDFQITTSGYYTKSYPAFWLDPNTYEAGCTWVGNGPWGGAGYSINKTPVSNFLLEKNVNIGFAGMDNVIEYNSRITIPNDQNQDLPIRYMIMVNPAVYMPVIFRLYYRYDPRSSSLSTTQPPNGYSTIPPIIATADQQYAMGLYTPSMLWDGYPENEQRYFVGYGGIDWGPTTSIFTRYPVYPPSGQQTFSPGGTYSYTSYLVIGSVNDVQSSLRQLYLYFNPTPTSTPIPPSPVPTSTPIPSSTPIPPTVTAILPTATPVPIAGDLNVDGKVNIYDYNQLISDFGKTGTSGFIPTDINKDGKVNIGDYNILVGNFGSPR